MLGTARYREIEEAHPMTPLAATLHALKRQGELDFDDVDLLSRMVDAVICKVAIMLPGQRIRRSSGRAGRRSSTACSGGPADVTLGAPRLARSIRSISEAALFPAECRRAQS